METDIREIFPAIRVPTLVLYLASHRLHARYVAARIPNATAIELPGTDHWLAHSEPFVGEIEEFLTGVRRTPDAERVLATVVFTDIVGSTERAADLGDRGWRDLLEMHHTLVRRELEQYRGREVNTTGDGFLATFDGPARAIRCAVAIRDAVRELGVEVRAGLHTGECEVVDGKVEGIAVHVGARVAGEALSWRSARLEHCERPRRRLGAEFADRGERELKDVPGLWRLYSVVDA